MKKSLRVPSVLRSRRALAAAATTTALAATLVAGGAAEAQADTNFTTHLSPNSSFGLLLDVPGGTHAPWTSIIQWYANGGANQSWSFQTFGGITYQIVNGESGECLTTDGVAGHDVYQLPCNGGPGQKWVTNLTPGSIYAWTIYNPLSGLYLDVAGASALPGAHIDVWYYNGGSNQYFQAL